MSQKGNSHIVRMNHFSDWQLEELIATKGYFKYKSNYIEYLVHREFVKHIGHIDNPYVKVPTNYEVNSTSPSA